MKRLLGPLLLLLAYLAPWSLYAAVTSSTAAAYDPTTADPSDVVVALSRLAELASAHAWRPVAGVACLLATSGLMRINGFRKLPEEQAKWVAAAIGALGALGGYLLIPSLSLFTAITAGLTTGPLATLIWEYVVAHWTWLHAILSRPMESDRTPDVGGPGTRVGVLLLAVSLASFQSGCGTLRSSTRALPTHLGATATASTAAMLARCDDLESRYALWGGLTALGGSLAGVGGLSTALLDPPPNDKAPRLVLGLVSLAIGAFSAFALFEEQDAAKRWTSTCQ